MLNSSLGESHLARTCFVNTQSCNDLGFQKTMILPFSSLGVSAQDDAIEMQVGAGFPRPRAPLRMGSLQGQSFIADSEEEPASSSLGRIASLYCWISLKSVQQTINQK